MKNKLKVFDIGGGYGIHPTWRNSETIIDYYLADPQEYEILRKKYKNNKNNFNLLNLDYDSKGDVFHQFADYRRHGILKLTDAVYIKNINYLIKIKKFDKLLKLIVFLFLNNGQDVAFYILNNIEDKMIKKLKKKDKLIEKIKFLVVKFIYQLKWQPGQDIKTHKKWYEKKFKESYPAIRLYNESNKFNTN